MVYWLHNACLQAASSSERRWLVSEADVIMLDDKHMPGYRCDLPVKLMVLSDSIQVRRPHMTAVRCWCCIELCRAFPASSPDWFNGRQPVM